MFFVPYVTLFSHTFMCIPGSIHVYTYRYSVYMYIHTYVHEYHIHMYHSCVMYVGLYTFSLDTHTVYIHVPTCRDVQVQYFIRLWLLYSLHYSLHKIMIVKNLWRLTKFAIFRCTLLVEYLIEELLHWQHSLVCLLLINSGLGCSPIQIKYKLFNWVIPF